MQALAVGWLEPPRERTMPIRIEREHHFAVPVETGFAFITDMANWPGYWPGFVRIESSSRWSAPGDEARIVVRLIGRNVELRMTLRHFEENQLVEYESIQSGMPDAHHERHFVPANGGFLYRLVVEYEPRSGLRGLYDRLLLRRGVERALRQTVANVEATLAA
jgi:Polyketide cyclase / dehydrase and lipid transport